MSIVAMLRRWSCWSPAREEALRENRDVSIRVIHAANRLRKEYQEGQVYRDFEDVVRAIDRRREAGSQT